jgi:hypothetical protein
MPKESQLSHVNHPFETNEIRAVIVHRLCTGGTTMLFFQSKKLRQRNFLAVR